MVASAPYWKVSHLFGDPFSSVVNYLLTDASSDKTDTRCWFPYQPVLAVMGSCFESLYHHLTFYRTDTSLRQTVGHSHDGWRFRESYLCREPCIQQTHTSALLVARRIFTKNNFHLTENLGRKFQTIGRFCPLITSLYTDVALFCFIFSFFSKTSASSEHEKEKLRWLPINPLRFIFYHPPRSTDFEQNKNGLWTG